MKQAVPLVVSIGISGGGSLSLQTETSVNSTEVEVITTVIVAIDSPGHTSDKVVVTVTSDIGKGYYNRGIAST